MQYKSGKCSKCLVDEVPIVNSTKKLCIKCNRERLLEKKISVPKKLKALKPLPKALFRHSQKPIKPSLTRSSVLLKDLEVYSQIWNTKPHVCEECDSFLGNEPKKEFFSHILPKGKYPSLRHDLENFNLLCFDCHYKWEFLNKKGMKIYQLNLERIEVLKQKDKSNFSSNESDLNSHENI